MRISSRLDKLALWYDYAIVCDNIRRTIISHNEPDEDGREMCQWGFELTNPVEYTREELLKKYDGKTKIYRWAHTFTEANEPAIALVIEKEVE